MVIATADDKQFFLATRDIQLAVGEVPQVARPQPPVLKRLAGGLRLRVITLHQAGAAYQYFTDPTFWHPLAGRADNGNFHLGNGHPY